MTLRNFDWCLMGVYAAVYVYLLIHLVRRRLWARRQRRAMRDAEQAWRDWWAENGAEWATTGPLTFTTGPTPLYRADLSLDRTAYPDHDEWWSMRRRDWDRPIETIDPL